MFNFSHLQHFTITENLWQLYAQVPKSPRFNLVIGYVVIFGCTFSSDSRHSVLSVNTVQGDFQCNHPQHSGQIRGRSHSGHVLPRIQQQLNETGCWVLETLTVRLVTCMARQKSHIIMCKHMRSYFNVLFLILVSINGWWTSEKAKHMLIHILILFKCILDIQPPSFGIKLEACYLPLSCS